MKISVSTRKSERDAYTLRLDKVPVVHSDEPRWTQARKSAVVHLGELSRWTTAEAIGSGSSTLGDVFFMSTLRRGGGGGGEEILKAIGSAKV